MTLVTGRRIANNSTFVNSMVELQDCIAVSHCPLLIVTDALEFWKTGKVRNDCLRSEDHFNASCCLYTQCHST